MMVKDTKPDIVTKVVNMFADFLSANGLSMYGVEIGKLLAKRFSNTQMILVKSPIALTKSQRSKAEQISKDLLKSIYKNTDFSDINFKYVLDESLIDGVRIEYMDRIWDLSVKNNLNNIINKSIYE